MHACILGSGIRDHVVGTCPCICQPGQGVSCVRYPPRCSGRASKLLSSRGGGAMSAMFELTISHSMGCARLNSNTQILGKTR